MPGESYLTKIIESATVETVSLPLPAAIQNRTSLDVLRLDQLHPVISGNKYFKLKYPVLHALASGKAGIASFGGAYSNHLVALAHMTQLVGLMSVGIVRGEKPAVLSSTLTDAESYGMTLKFVSRGSYADKKELHEFVSAEYPGYHLVPEGGQSVEGVKGAAEILALAPDATNYDYIVCAAGTGTMMAGLLQSSAGHQQVLGIPVLKLPAENDIGRFITRMAPGKPFKLNYEFHFGGYAKKTSVLIEFMNMLWDRYQLPTDFVYTAKMMFAIDKLLQEGYFKTGSSILAIHSGGLQGNRSIAGELVFREQFY